MPKSREVICVKSYRRREGIGFFFPLLLSVFWEGEEGGIRHEHEYFRFCVNDYDLMALKRFSTWGVLFFSFLLSKNGHDCEVVGSGWERDGRIGRGQRSNPLPNPICNNRNLSSFSYQRGSVKRPFCVNLIHFSRHLSSRSIY